MICRRVPSGTVYLHEVHAGTEDGLLGLLRCRRRLRRLLSVYATRQTQRDHPAPKGRTDHDLLLGAGEDSVSRRRK